MREDVDIFDLPAVENPEPAPARVEHLCDYDVDGGQTSFYYNFLDYAWLIDGEEVRARAYLDEPRKVAIFAPFARIRDNPAFAPMLRFFMRRFSYIDTFEKSEGCYVQRYRARDASEPGAGGT